MATGTPKIFVSIASYRDPECQWTIKDLFEKATLPDRVFVGLCWQVLADQDEDCSLFQVRPEQCRVVTFSALESKGACWARHQVQTLFRGEDYYFQIDSHMRFTQDWDEKLLAMLAACPSRRPILSSYPPSYTPPDQLQDGSFTVLKAGTFNDQGILGLHSNLISVKDAPARPVPNPFCAGGLLFAPAAAIADVPYDPHLYFTGEEITLAVRFWTHGWDIFSPNDVIAYHDYGHNRRRHWQDNKQWGLFSQKSARRLRHMLTMEPTQDPEIIEEVEKYGLGTVRDLASWQAFSGIDFATRTVEPRPAGPPWPEPPPWFTVSILGLTAADIPTLLTRGRALRNEGQAEAAITTFDQILALQPGHIDAAYARANALLHLKRYAEAIDSYQMTLASPVYKPEALYGTAIALDNLQRYPEAIAALSEAAALRPETHYLRLLGMVCARIGDSAGAADAQRRVAATAHP